MDRGGLAHADTGAEATNFLFEIHPDYLLPALDRFAHLFVDPLLNKNTVLRERESIDNGNGYFTHFLFIGSGKILSVLAVEVEYLFF